jgi:ABC-type molybdate transport system substrate-binding protein
MLADDGQVGDVAVVANSTEMQSAKALIVFLKSTHAAAAIAKAGVEPLNPP